MEHFSRWGKSRSWKLLPAFGRTGARSWGWQKLTLVKTIKIIRLANGQQTLNIYLYTDITQPPDTNWDSGKTWATPKP